MTTSTRKHDDAVFEGLPQILQHLYNSFDNVAIRCALELRIADIINNHGDPMTLSQIANGINSNSLDIDGLSRLMMFLVHRKMFNKAERGPCEEPLYSLNTCSKWLLHDSKTTLAPLAMLATDSGLSSHFFNLSKSIREGGTTVKNTFGVEFWDLASVNSHANQLFNEAMVCRTRITIAAIMSNYRFEELRGTLVDVGGGHGAALNEIVSTYPHINGINFDLPHVISTAPTYEGITHVEGDMFKSIPHGDSILLKSILHNWSDDKCVEILKNCRNALSQGTGKLLIVDIILDIKGDDMFDDTRMAHDLVMISSCGGKERSIAEWKIILEEAGFSRYSVIKIPALESIIEAYSD